MRSGRPVKRQVQLKNGFYIEVCDKGTKKGVKIWSETKVAMDIIASQYSDFKVVLILGEYKDGTPFRDKSAA